MKKEDECFIVQDLLLNYVDGVLSETTEKFVNIHIKNCKNCQEKLKIINKNIEQEENMKEKKEIDYLKNINRKLNKKTLWIFVSTILLAIIVFFNIAVFINYNEVASEVQIYFDANATEDEISNVEEMIKSKYQEVQIIYISKEDSLQKLKEKFKEKENLLDGFDINILSASYLIKADIETIKDIANMVQDVPQVKKVQTSVDENPYLLFIYKNKISDL